MMTKTAMAGVCVAALIGGRAMAEGDGFKTTLALGLNLTDGNSETMQANGSLVSEGEKAHLGSVRMGVEANYGETTVDGTDQKNVDNGKAFANARKTLSERTFLYVDSAVGYDDISLIDYRATLGVGAGGYLAKSDALKLSLEAGVSYISEDVAGQTADYAALRVAERVEYKFTETAKLWQSAEYLPQTDDFGNYLLTAEVGAEAALNATMNLRILLQDKYDSEPGAGLEKNDLSLISGVSVKL